MPSYILCNTYERTDCGDLEIVACLHFFPPLEQILLLAEEAVKQNTEKLNSISYQ